MAKITATVYGDRTQQEIETRQFYASTEGNALEIARRWFAEFGDGYGCVVSNDAIGAMADWHN